MSKVEDEPAVPALPKQPAKVEHFDQNERDYKTLTDAVKDGRIKAETGV